MSVPIHCKICGEEKSPQEVSGFSFLDQVCWECQSNPLALAVRQAQDLKTELLDLWMVAERKEAREKSNVT